MCIYICETISLKKITNIFITFGGFRMPFDVPVLHPSPTFLPSPGNQSTDRSLDEVFRLVPYLYEGLMIRHVIDLSEDYKR